MTLITIKSKEELKESKGIKWESELCFDWHKFRVYAMSKQSSRINKIKENQILNKSQLENQILK